VALDETKERMEQKASRLQRAEPGAPGTPVGEGVATMMVPLAPEFKLGLESQSVSGGLAPRVANEV
jgi:hypothetical protein